MAAMAAALVAIGALLAQAGARVPSSAAIHEAGAAHGEKSASERPYDGWSTVLRAAAGRGGGEVERQNAAKCVDIPSNFSLCHGIQYTSMRLPNLLDHDTLHEAIQQSEAWNSLLQLHCHPDAKLYLCSLFAPLCLPNLDKPLYPCQSLCLSVQQGCESRMAQYGFPWPEMLRCRFPADNDMCIKPAQSTTESQHVWKVRLKSANSTHITVAKMRGFKSGLRASSEASKSTERRLRGEHVLAISAESIANTGAGKPCTCPSLRQKAAHHGANFLLMAGDAKAAGGRAAAGGGSKLPTVATLIVPWRSDDKNFKRAIRRYRKVNCSTLGREIRESVLRHNFKPPGFRGHV